MTGMGSHQSGVMLKDEWLTPPAIIDALGPFDLDPCAPINPPWRMAAKHFTLLDNGLKQPWDGYVWCNPPYGRESSAWLERLADHGNGIALVFARTETELFFSQVWGRATALLFLQDRLHFHHVDGTRGAGDAGAPSVLIAYGESASWRLQHSGIAGQFIRP